MWIRLILLFLIFLHMKHGMSIILSVLSMGPSLVAIIPPLFDSFTSSKSTVLLVTATPLQFINLDYGIC